MNSGAQGQGQGQPAQGQPAGAQQRPSAPMYRPEQMRSLPDQFTPQEKEKWEQGLRALWGQVEKNGPETQAHQDAKRKLFEFSKTLAQKMQVFRMQQKQAAAAQQAGGARPGSQGQPQQQPGDNNAPNQNSAQQQPRPQPKISQKVMEHVSNFPYVLPPQLSLGTPEAGKWMQEAKSRYLKGLVAMENATTRIGAMEATLQKRNDEGKALSPEEEKEFKEKKEVAQKAHSEAKSFVDNFRQQQQQQRAAANANSQQGNAGQQQSGNGNASNGGQPGPARPQLNTQQPANPALQNTQTVNAAIEAARNQQAGGIRPSMQQNGQMSQPPQMPNQNAPSQQNMPQHQGGQVQNIKTEAGVPPQINTAVTQMQQGQRGSIGNNSPQSAVPQSAGAPQSATSQQVPKALNQQQALQTAARTYSSGQTSGTPNVMGHSHTHPSAPRETQNVITNKMPIPKHLPERATAPPQPVQLNQSRPTFSGGPSNVGNGVMSQPVLQKPPGYDLTGEGNGRVLSKKKLDELVRQVTGGGEGLGGGETLTPEVEEVRSMFFLFFQKSQIYTPPLILSLYILLV
jgi:transcription initiation factor TFIID subunit 12